MFFFLFSITAAVCDASTNTAISSPPASLSGHRHDTTSAGVKNHHDISSSSHAKTQRTAFTSPSLSKHHRDTTSASNKSQHNTSSRHHNTTSASTSQTTYTQSQSQLNASTSLSKHRQYTSTKASPSISSRSTVCQTTPTKASYRYSTTHSTHGHPTASTGSSLSEHLHRQTQATALATKSQPTSVSKPRHRTSSTSQPSASSNDANSTILKRYHSLTDISSLSHLLEKSTTSDTTAYSLSRRQEHASNQAISSGHAYRPPSPIPSRSKYQASRYTYGSTNFSTSPPPYPDHLLSSRHLSTAQTGSLTSSHTRTQPNTSYYNPTHGSSSMPLSPSGSHYGRNTAQSSPLSSYSRHDFTTTTQSRSVTTRSQPDASTDVTSSSLAKYHHRSPTHSSSSTPSPSRSHRDPNVSPSPPPPSYFSRHHHSTPQASGALTTKSQPTATTTVTDTPGFSPSKYHQYASTIFTASAPSSYTHTSAQPLKLSSRRTRSGSVSTSNPAELAEKRVQSPLSPPTASHRHDESLRSSSSGRLRRSNSTSSVADCMKWEEKKHSPDNILGGGDSQGKKSSRRRIRSLLKRFTCK